MAEKWQIGGYHTDTLTGKAAKVVMFNASLNNSGAPGKVLGVDYAVTAGKTFYITGILIQALTVNTTTFNLRYADNVAMTTNPVTIGFDITIPAAVVAGNMPNIIPLFGLSAAASKYVGFFSAEAAARTLTCIIFGYEA